MAEEGQNLLAPGDKRDPRTLGDNIIPSPGGPVDTTDLLAAREESDQTVAKIALEQIKELNKRLQVVQGTEFHHLNETIDPNFFGDVVDPGKRKLLRLNRALGRERIERHKFEMAKSDREIAIMRQIVPLMARLREASPNVDILAKEIAKDTAARLVQIRKEQTAPIVAERSIQVFLNAGMDRAKVPAVRQALIASIIDAPNPEEVLTKHFQREKAMTDVSEFYTDARADKFLSKDDAALVKRARTVKGSKAPRASKTPIKTFMERDSLIKEWKRILQATTDEVRTEEFIPGVDEGFAGVLIPKQDLIDMTPRLTEFIEKESAVRFADVVRGVTSGLGQAGSEAKVRKAFTDVHGLSAGDLMLQAVAEITGQGEDERFKEGRRIIFDILQRKQAQSDLINQQMGGTNRETGQPNFVPQTPLTFDQFLNFGKADGQ